MLNEEITCEYHFGIIDYLQDYNLDKRLETLIKTKLSFNTKESEISCVPPKLYANRFKTFMERYVFNQNQNDKVIYNNNFIKKLK